MDTPDLAAMAAQALTAAVSGAANTAASELARGRLSRSARGRAALEELTDTPDDPEASRSAQAALAEEISADGEFADRLAVLLNAPSHQHTGSVVVTGSKVTRSQFALGPLTINNTRTGRLSLAVGVVLALAMVALAVYGGVRLVDDDAPPRGASSDRGAARADGRSAALPPTTDTVRRILPDRGSMDAEVYPWAGTPKLRTSAAELRICRAAPACRTGATAVGAVDFGRGENEGENKAEFLVMAFPSAAAARLAYADIVDDIEQAEPRSAAVELEARGAESRGIDHDGAVDVGDSGDESPSHVNRSLIFRQGAFIGIAHQMDDPTERRATRVNDLSALLAARIAKADAGQAP
ncbi:hypothetical protein ACIBKX_14660 [Streptomyces sp. NPDC050658]|uniref:hypothetical protein n=1 Tax=unclassified Streptomyces TaxID=2593676 RepID=UPI0034223F99